MNELKNVEVLAELKQTHNAISEFQPADASGGRVGRQGGDEGGRPRLWPRNIQITCDVKCAIFTQKARFQWRNLGRLDWFCGLDRFLPYVTGHAPSLASCAP